MANELTAIDYNRMRDDILRNTWELLLELNEVTGCNFDLPTDEFLTHRAKIAANPVASKHFLARTTEVNLKLIIEKLKKDNACKDEKH